MNVWKGNNQRTLEILKFSLQFQVASNSLLKMILQALLNQFKGKLYFGSRKLHLTNTNIRHSILNL